MTRNIDKFVNFKLKSNKKIIILGCGNIGKFTQIKNYDEIKLI